MSITWFKRVPHLGVFAMADRHVELLDTLESIYGLPLTMSLFDWLLNARKHGLITQPELFQLFQSLDGAGAFDDSEWQKVTTFCTQHSREG